MGLKNTMRECTFASVTSDGVIRVKVDEGTEGAKFRSGKLRDGSEFSKWELVYNELFGMITNIEFYEGDYGKNLQISIKDTDDEEPTVLCLAVKSNFGEDLMKKLPNVDLSKPVLVKPYSFTDDKGKTKKGVTVIQDIDKKIPSFFSETGADGKMKLVNGLPAPEEGKTYDTDDWNMYFTTVRKFLVSYTEEHVIPKLSKPFDLVEAVGGEEISVDDIKM